MKLIDRYSDTNMIIFDKNMYLFEGYSILDKLSHDEL